MRRTRNPMVTASLMAAVLLAACGTSDDRVTDAVDAVDVDPPASASEEPDAPEPDDAADPADDTDLVADGVGASRDNPVPLGQTARFGQPAFGVWDITVTGVNLDADDSDDRLQDGEQRVEVTVEFTNRSEATSLSTATNLNQSGAADAVMSYGMLTHGCGVPLEVDFSNPMVNLEPGESSEKLMCWQTQAAGIDTLAVFFAPFYDADQQIWFALR